MSIRRKVAREVVGAVEERTTFNWKVLYSKDDPGGKRIETYYGFGEVRRLDMLSISTIKGLLAVMDEDQIRWFVYDLQYGPAMQEFNRYWRDCYGEYPVYRKLSYKLEREG